MRFGLKTKTQNIMCQAVVINIQEAIDYLKASSIGIANLLAAIPEGQASPVYRRLLNQKEVIDNCKKELDGSAPNYNGAKYYTESCIAEDWNTLDV